MLKANLKTPVNISGTGLIAIIALLICTNPCLADYLNAGHFMIKQLKPAAIFEIIFHVLLWIIITLVPILLGPYPDLPHYALFTPWHFVPVNLLLAAQFYLNAFFLIPVILKKNQKIVLYFSLLLLSILVIDILLGYVKPPMPPLQNNEFKNGPPAFPVVFNIFPVILITAASFAYRYLSDQIKIINTKRDIDNQALLSELAFLRSQISPHFMFNVINSVVSLSRLNVALVEPTLMQLSKLMRYMLYISDEKKITLAEKAEYLQSYIELQKLRLGDLVKVTLNIEIKVPEKSLEPMLLIPFVENAFKHWAPGDKDSKIDISLRSDREKLNLWVQNSFDPNSRYKDDDHGIGLSNVKRRLELLYPGKHNLLVSADHKIYTVDLLIYLK